MDENLVELSQKMRRRWVDWMALAVNDERNDPSGGTVLYLESGKGEQYSFLPFKKWFKKALHV